MEDDMLISQMPDIKAGDDVRNKFQIGIWSLRTLQLENTMEVAMPTTPNEFFKAAQEPSHVTFFPSSKRYNRIYHNSLSYLNSNFDRGGDGNFDRGVNYTVPDEYDDGSNFNSIKHLLEDFKMITYCKYNEQQVCPQLNQDIQSRKECFSQC